MNVSDNLINILKSVPQHVKVVPISKFQPVDKMLQIYDYGYKIFGENKAQDLAHKQKTLPQDIEWHFVGHLQTNKVKFLAPFINLIHSVDSMKILSEINKEALKKNRIIDCLLQFHIANEESKFGLNIPEAEGILNSDLFHRMQNIRICGVMGMATFTDDMNMVRNEFKSLKQFFDILKNKYFSDDEAFKEISMGMTQDYRIAIEEGSTIIRIGTAIFGEV